VIPARPSQASSSRYDLWLWLIAGLLALVLGLYQISDTLLWKARRGLTRIKRCDKLHARNGAKRPIPRCGAKGLWI
jgi:hypothetical protein